MSHSLETETLLVLLMRARVYVASRVFPTQDAPEWTLCSASDSSAKDSAGSQCPYAEIIHSIFGIHAHSN